MWLLLLGVALVEVVAHFVQQARVEPWSDWEAAAAHVRAEWQPGDAVTVAPRWADPLMRASMGETLDLELAGRAELETAARLWSFSIRGHRAPDAPPSAPEHTAQYGRVRLDRWTLTPQPVLFDFVEHIEDAQVSLIQSGEERACRLQRGSRPTGGGLGSGPLRPATRHICDPARDWLWVGATVEEDLEMLPRRCVWQHPQGMDPVRARFTEVTLGRAVVLYAGLWWEHERTLSGGQVDVVVRLDGQELGRLEHTDGDGWERLEVPIPADRRGQAGTVEIDTIAPNPHLRSLCWAATMRGER